MSKSNPGFLKRLDGINRKYNILMPSWRFVEVFSFVGFAIFATLALIENEYLNAGVDPVAYFPMEVPQYSFAILATIALLGTALLIYDRRKNYTKELPN